MWRHRGTRRDQADSRSANAHYATLRRASRPRRWVLAVAVGTVIGAVLGVRVGWWLGAPVAVVIVALVLVWDWRSGILGAWPGDEGSHRLTAVLARLERQRWVVLRAPTLPDHDVPRPIYLLIGRHGVYVVEHQVWPAGERVTTNPGTGLLEVAGRTAARRTTGVRAAAAAVGECLSDALPQDIRVQPVLAIHGLAIDQPRSTVGVSLVPIADLAREVRRSNVELGDARINTIAAAARRVLSPSAEP